MPGTGDVDLGPMGNLEGRLPGLKLATRLLSRTPEFAEVGRQFGMLKGYNDSPVGGLAGSWSGRPVRTGPAQEGQPPAL